MGDATFNHLRQVIPPTWIVGQEKYFSGGMPDGVAKSSDLASLSKSKRTMVLKSSGFAPNSSWSEGVVFLHQKSQERARKVLQDAENDQSYLHIVQAFSEGVRIPMVYYDDDGSQLITMIAKVRITPYFSLSDGRLIAIKATACENTDYIHATSASINTAVSKAA